MAAKTTRLEREKPERSVKVILIGGVVIEAFGEDSLFEVLRCENVNHLARLWEGAEASVVLVNFEGLSEGERANLRKQVTRFEAVPVVAVADSVDDEMCEKLLRTGCMGSLRRREDATTITRAVKAVIAGELWFPRATLSRVLRGFLVAHDPDRLTSRELEILPLVGADLNNQQIGDKLFISRETVRWHIKSLHAKLGTRTRRGLSDHVRLMNRVGKMMPVQRESGSSPQSLAG